MTSRYSVNKWAKTCVAPEGRFARERPTVVAELLRALRGLSAKRWRLVSKVGGSSQSRERGWEAPPTNTAASRSPTRKSPGNSAPTPGARALVPKLQFGHEDEPRTPRLGITFSARYLCAVKIAAGEINAVSGGA